VTPIRLRVLDAPISINRANRRRRQMSSRRYKFSRKLALSLFLLGFFSFFLLRLLIPIFLLSPRNSIIDIISKVLSQRERTLCHSNERERERERERKREKQVLLQIFVLNPTEETMFAKARERDGRAIVDSWELLLF